MGREAEGYQILIVPGRGAGWLAGWLAGCMAGWMAAWPAAWLAGGIKIGHVRMCLFLVLAAV